MIWYVATLAKVVLVEAPHYGAAKKKGREEIQRRWGGRVIIATCRQATQDDLSLHLLGSNVQIAGVR